MNPSNESPENKEQAEAIESLPTAQGFTPAASTASQSAPEAQPAPAANGMPRPDFYQAAWRSLVSSNGHAAPGSSESKENWDKMAPSFAKKPVRSDYISQLIRALNLREGESVFDMGCGPGTLSIPLAHDGHDVVAVDFSDGMLEELQAALKTAGTTRGTVEVHQRSWQESWSDLPEADVAVSSRSFITSDLAEGIAKLESKARRCVALTVGAGDMPYRDSRICEALGRPVEATPSTELFCLVSYLFSIGRLPSVTYLEHPGHASRKTREELEAALTRAHRPKTSEEAALLKAHLDEHIVYDETSASWKLDYARLDRWALVTWNIDATQPIAGLGGAPRIRKRLAAKACIFKEGRMLVLRKPEADRKRSAASEREDDLPGGCIEDGETMREALVREIREETGLEVEVDRPFNSWGLIRPTRQILGVDFICHWKSGDVALSHEHESFEWMSLEEIKTKDWASVPTYEEAFRLARER